MHRQQAIEYLRRHDAGVGDRELKPNRRGLQAGDQEKEQAARDVHEAEPLVIDGDDPFVQLAEDRQRLRVVDSAECDLLIDAARHALISDQRSVAR